MTDTPQDPTVESEVEDSQIKNYVVFGPNRIWTQTTGVRFEYNKYGDLLFFDEEGSVKSSVSRGHSISVIKKDEIDLECLYNWGIEKRPPAASKQLTAVELIEQRKVILDEVENTSLGFRAAVFDANKNLDEVIGEFDTFDQAVRSVWEHKQAKNAEARSKIDLDLQPTDDEGYYARNVVLPTVPSFVDKVPVSLKYSSGKTERGWYTSDEKFKRIVLLFGLIDLYTQLPKDMVVGWKPRKIYPNSGPK